MSRIDPLWHALSKLRRGKYEECIAICDEMLANNPQDQVTFHHVKVDCADLALPIAITW